MKLKKLLSSILLFSACSIFAGCVNINYSNIEGYADVNNAKKLYAELNSAHFYMQDNTTGQISEEFTFMYNSNGNLLYSHTATDGENVYYEYCNGAELSTKHKSDENWTLLTYGDEGFQVYTREKKHPYTDEGVISVNAYAITDSLVEKTDEGEKVFFNYNPKALADSLSELGELKSFESTIWLNNEGYCFRLDQRAVFENNGEQVSDYSLFIDNMNDVAEIIKPKEWFSVFEKIS